MRPSCNGFFPSESMSAHRGEFRLRPRVRPYNHDARDALCWRAAVQRVVVGHGPAGASDALDEARSSAAVHPLPPPRGPALPAPAKTEVAATSSFARRGGLD